MRRPGPDDDIAAVAALAIDLGLGSIDPIILKLAHHTTIRLSPLPIVARVQSSEPLDRAAEAMAREVELARHLADRGAPAVAPTTDPPPGPYIRDRAAITLWAFVEHSPAREGADLTQAARALRLIHAALLSFNGDLPPFTRVLDRCGRLLGDWSAMPTIAAEDRAFLQERFWSLREGLASFSLNAVPLHGDTHAGNVLMTSNGPIWADLEAICVGPLEWDLTPLPTEARSLFGGVDAALLDHLTDLRSVAVAVWCWLDASRSDEMRSAAEYHLHRLRRRASVAGSRA